MENEDRAAARRRGPAPLPPMDEETERAVLEALDRYIGRYQWSFNMARRLINRSCGTQFTDKQLARFYRRHRAEDG